MPGQNAFFAEHDETLDPLVHIHEAVDPQGRGAAAHTDGAHTSLHVNAHEKTLQNSVHAASGQGSGLQPPDAGPAVQA